jgi:hypothetical protein
MSATERVTSTPRVLVATVVVATPSSSSLRTRDAMSPPPISVLIG